MVIKENRVELEEESWWRNHDGRPLTLAKGLELLNDALGKLGNSHCAITLPGNLKNATHPCLLCTLGRRTIVHDLPFDAITRQWMKVVAGKYVWEADFPSDKKGYVSLSQRYTHARYEDLLKSLLLSKEDVFASANCLRISSNVPFFATSPTGINELIVEYTNHLFKEEKTSLVAQKSGGSFLHHSSSSFVTAGGDKSTTSEVTLIQAADAAASGSLESKSTARNLASSLAAITLSGSSTNTAAAMETPAAIAGVDLSKTSSKLMGKS